MMTARMVSGHEENEYKFRSRLSDWEALVLTTRHGMGKSKPGVKEKSETGMAEGFVIRMRTEPGS
jgi:hypothetical protein